MLHRAILSDFNIMFLSFFCSQCRNFHRQHLDQILTKFAKIYVRKDCKLRVIIFCITHFLYFDNKKIGFAVQYLNP